MRPIALVWYPPQTLTLSYIFHTVNIDYVATSTFLLFNVTSTRPSLIEASSWDAICSSIDIFSHTYMANAAWVWEIIVHTICNRCSSYLCVVCGVKQKAWQPQQFGGGSQRLCGRLCCKLCRLRRAHHVTLCGHGMSFTWSQLLLAVHVCVLHCFIEHLEYIKL